MKKSKDLLFSALINRNTMCKFTSLCNLYSSASYTCTHTGGNYCGKYRKLNDLKEKLGNQNQTIMEVAQ